MGIIGFDAHGNWFDINEGMTIMAVPHEDYEDVMRCLREGRHLEGTRYRSALSYVEGFWMNESWPEESAHDGARFPVLDYFTQEERVWKRG